MKYKYIEMLIYDAFEIMSALTLILEVSESIFKRLELFAAVIDYSSRSKGAIILATQPIKKR